MFIPKRREKPESMSPVRTFIQKHKHLEMGAMKQIHESQMEDLATDILLDIKKEWDVEGPMELNVIKLIGRELLHEIFANGIQIELKPPCSDRDLGQAIFI